MVLVFPSILDVKIEIEKPSLPMPKDSNCTNLNKLYFHDTPEPNNLREPKKSPRRPKNLLFNKLKPSHLKLFNAEKKHSKLPQKWRKPAPGRPTELLVLELTRLVLLLKKLPKLRELPLLMTKTKSFKLEPLHLKQTRFIAILIKCLGTQIILLFSHFFG